MNDKVNDAVVEHADEGAFERTREALGGIWAILRRDKSALVGLSAIFFLVIVAIAAPLIAPFHPSEQSMLNRFSGPSAQFWLGTDEYGRDIFSRIVHATRPALIVGVFSVGVAMLIGVPLGILAGFYLGWFDRAISWLVDIMLAFPSLLLALMVVALLGPGTMTVVIAIAISQVPLFIRLARGSTLVVKNADYVKASRSFGARDSRLMIRHILPNILGPLIIMGTLSIAGAIRDEAALSFLGLGIQPPVPSWGNMVRDGVNQILQTPWLAIFPGLAVTLSVLAFNMIGDSLRDIFDPRDLAAQARGRKRAEAKSG